MPYRYLTVSATRSVGSARQAELEGQERTQRFRIFHNLIIRMFSSKDYSTMTRDQLVSEEKKLKSQKTATAVFIGFLVSIAVWAASHTGFVLPVTLLIFSFLIGYRYSQNLKGIQAEISRRDTVH